MQDSRRYFGMYRIHREPGMLRIETVPFWLKMSFGIIPLVAFLFGLLRLVTAWIDYLWMFISWPDFLMASFMLVFFLVTGALLICHFREFSVHENNRSIQLKRGFIFAFSRQTYVGDDLNQVEIVVKRPLLPLLGIVPEYVVRVRDRSGKVSWSLYQSSTLAYARYIAASIGRLCAIPVHDESPAFRERLGRHPVWKRICASFDYMGNAPLSGSVMKCERGGRAATTDPVIYRLPVLSVWQSLRWIIGMAYLIVGLATIYLLTWDDWHGDQFNLALYFFLIIAVGAILTASGWCTRIRRVVTVDSEGVKVDTAAGGKVESQIFAFRDIIDIEIFEGELIVVTRDCGYPFGGNLDSTDMFWLRNELRAAIANRSGSS